MSKLHELEKDMAEVLKKHELEKAVGVKAEVIAKYLTTQMGALKTAYKEAKETENER